MSKRTTMLIAVIMLITASVAFGQDAPKTALEFNKRGSTYLKSKEYSKAVADFNQAIRLEPTGVNTGIYYFNRGAAYSKLEDFDKAIADFNQAEKLLPNDEDVYAWRGDAYSLKREQFNPKDDYNDLTRRALADLNRAIQIKPDYAWAYGRRAYFNNNGGLSVLDQALADYAKSIQLNPNDPEVYKNRAELYSMTIDDYPKAIADYTQAIKLNPNDASYYGDRGEIYRKMAASGKVDYSLAIADFTQAIKLDPKDPTNYSARGKTYYSMKSYRNAIADLEQALKLWTGHKGDYYSDIQYYLSEAKKKL